MKNQFLLFKFLTDSSQRTKRLILKYYSFFFFKTMLMINEILDFGAFI